MKTIYFYLNFSKQKSAVLLLFICLVNLQLLGQRNNSLHFDGEDDHIELGSIPFYQGNFTVEGWIKAEKPQESSTIFYARDGNQSSIYAEVTLNGTIRFIVHNPSKTSASIEVAGKISLFDGRWHHFAAVKNKDKKLYLYVDGKADGSSSHTVGNFLPIIDQEFLLGANPEVDRRYFKGNMDEIRLWNRERSLDEIKSDMNVALDGVSSGLIAYYNFNQGKTWGDNSSITELIASVGNSRGKLKNFRMSGSSSTFQSGVPHSPPKRLFVSPNGWDKNSGTTWNSAFRTLSRAIEKAEAGTEICLEKGIYELAGTITLKKGLSIRGGFKGSEYNTSNRVLSASGSSSILNLTLTDKEHLLHLESTARKVMLEKLEFRSGNYQHIGIYIEGESEDSKYQISFCKFESLQKAIHISANGKVDISHSSFSGLKAGAISIEGNKGYLKIESSTFTNNFNTVGYGGAIFAANSSSLDLKNSLFRSNSAKEGGAIFCTEASISADNCIFEKNTSTKGSGGAICLKDASCSANTSNKSSLIDCTFSENKARKRFFGRSEAPVGQLDGNGGAIYARNSDVDLRKTCFVKNTGQINPFVPNINFNASAICFIDARPANLDKDNFEDCGRPSSPSLYIADCAFLGHRGERRAGIDEREPSVVFCSGKKLDLINTYFFNNQVRYLVRANTRVNISDCRTGGNTYKASYNRDSKNGPKLDNPNVPSLTLFGRLGSSTYHELTSKYQEEDEIFIPETKAEYWPISNPNMNFDLYQDSDFDDRYERDMDHDGDVDNEDKVRARIREGVKFVQQNIGACIDNQGTGCSKREDIE